MTTCRYCFAEIEFNEVDGWVHKFSQRQQCSDGSPERAEPDVSVGHRYSARRL